MDRSKPASPSLEEVSEDTIESTSTVEDISHMSVPWFSTDRLAALRCMTSAKSTQTDEVEHKADWPIMTLCSTEVTETVDGTTKSTQTYFLPFETGFFSDSRELLTVCYSQEADRAIESFHSASTMTRDPLYSTPEGSAPSEVEVEVRSGISIEPPSPKSEPGDGGSPS